MAGKLKANVPSGYHSITEREAERRVEKKERKGWKGRKGPGLATEWVKYTVSSAVRQGFVAP